MLLRRHAVEVGVAGIALMVIMAVPTPTFIIGREPCPRIEPDHRSAQTAHGRRKIRTIKVVTIAGGIEFSHAAGSPAVRALA